MHRANHVVESHKVGAPTDGKDESADECTNKALDGLLGGKTDEWGPAHGDTTDVCPAVVADDERGGNPEPDQSFQNVIDDKVAV